jgi:hypothetical protein
VVGLRADDDRSSVNLKDDVVTGRFAEPPEQVLIAVELRFHVRDRVDAVAAGAATGRLADALDALIADPSYQAAAGMILALGTTALRPESDPRRGLAWPETVLDFRSAANEKPEPRAYRTGCSTTAPKDA